MTGLDAHCEAYREEAAELLVELEKSLLELEQTPDDHEIVGSVFRAMHTIKGSGAMFGFDAIAAFTHELETVFDLVREGKMPVTPALIDITLASKDHIRVLLGGEPDAAVLESGSRILDRLHRLVEPAEAGQAETAVATAPQTPRSPAGDEPETTYRIRFAPHADIFRDGTNPLLLLRELEKLGQMSLLAHPDQIPELDQYDPESCYTSWDAVLTTSAGEDAIRDVFIFVEDSAEIAIAPARSDDSTKGTLLGEILVDRGEVSKAEVDRVLESRPKIGTALVEAGIVNQKQVRAALLEQQHLQEIRKQRQKSEPVATVRVPAAKLDGLVNIIGELVTVQARLSGHALETGNPETTFIAEEVERLTEMLRERTMSLRMTPIGETFARFRRLVRDLASDLEKKVEMRTEGDETELDKNVIEQLNDPLVHLIRNAIDHGLESPQQRLAAGKPATGQIRLSASHSGAFVLICVSDDGAGLDRDAIRERAVQRGLLAPDAVVSDQEIYRLVLAPGFSTAAAVTEISGRGVGMDVVKRSIDTLRGDLSIDSRRGQGTTVTLKIPLTLAIIDGLLVMVGDCYYVLPLANILECIELQRGPAGTGGGRSIITVRDELVPYIALRDRFQIGGERPAIEQVIVADTREGKCGLVVDRVIGDHHTVIKKLGGLFRHVDEISGATILGDGTVALILDAGKLVAEAVRNAAPASPLATFSGH